MARTRRRARRPSLPAIAGQPRFAWNLWFAALAPREGSPWVLAAEARLLAAEPAVLARFARDPFAGAQPAAVRTVLWQYRFTDRRTRAASGAWWRREVLRDFAPAVDRASLPAARPPG